MTGVQVLKDVYTPAGSWSVLIADWVYVRADGTVVQQLTSGQYPVLSGGSTNAQYDTAFSAVVEDVPVEQDPVVPWSGTNAQATHYYVADHLGTAQMEFASGGWPVWKGDFAPYGQEIGPQQTVNNYKFTGLERDPETGLDHTQFRQLSSFQGRWMSPDPYGGSMDLGNPQSFNRYSYVGNNPLGFTDPSGLDRDGLGGIQLGFGCIGAAASGGGNVAADIGCGLNTLLHLLNLFHRPVFRGTLQPRPNGQIWDEHGSYKPKPYSSAAEILGLGQAGCEFGACGGGSSIFPGQDAARAGRDVGTWAAGYAYNVLNLLLYTPANREAPRRFFGTYYCGPGGRGPNGGIVNRACAIHDNCFTDAGINADGNTQPNIKWSFAQVIAASNCNQNLYNSVKGFPDEAGSESIQFWLKYGDRIGILRRGTAVVP